MTPIKPRLMVPNEASQATGHSIDPDLSEDLGRAELRPWLLCLSVLPFLAIPMAHLLSNVETATGLFHYELPYYVANGRAALERGNGFFYPNPFDPAVDAPAIYVHWLPEVMGIATSVFRADPGSLILWLTFAAALAFAAATQRLVTACLPNSVRDSSFPFLAVMWGGGFLAIGSAVSGLLARIRVQTCCDWILATACGFSTGAAMPCFPRKRFITPLLRVAGSRKFADSKLQRMFFFFCWRRLIPGPGWNSC